MRKSVCIFLVFLCVFCTQVALAQPQSQLLVADQEKKILATRLHQVKPVKPIIDAAIYALSSQVLEKDRESFVNTLMLATDYDAVERASIESMAKTFTTAELKTMLTYYSSDEARSAEGKMQAYLNGLQDSIQKAIDRGVLKSAQSPQTVPEKSDQ